MSTHPSQYTSSTLTMSGHLQSIATWHKWSIGFLFILVQGYLTFGGPSLIFTGELADPDSYMRVSRVIQLYETGDWQDAFFPRSNAPYGEILHWTRPLDAYLVLGGIIGNWGGSFANGVWRTGVMLGPLVHAFALCGVLWIGMRLFPSKHVLLLVAIFLMQPGITAFFVAGAVDHHGLLSMLCIWMIGMTWATWKNTYNGRFASIAGAIMAFDLWVSTESVMVIGVCMAGLVGAWVWEPRDHAKKNLVLTGVIVAILGLALLIERPWSSAFSEEFDKISIVHLVLIAFLWGFWFIAFQWQQWFSGHARTRILFCTVWGFVMVLVVGIVFPKFLHGPMVDIDPRVMDLLWRQVAQVQPLLGSKDLQIGPLIFWVGIGLPAIPFSVWLLWTEKHPDRKPFWILTVLGVFIFIPLTFYQIRWAGYAEIFLMFSYVEFLTRVGAAIRKRIEAEWSDLIYACFLAGGTVWTFFVGISVIQAEAGSFPPPYRVVCPTRELAEFLNESPGLADTSQTIEAYLFNGPELLYRTKHTVLGTPYHRNREGIIDGHTVLASKNDETIKEIVERRKIDLLLLCPHSQEERGYFVKEGEAGSLYQRLEEQHIPSWLHRLPLPEPLSENFALFRVQR